MNANGEGHRDRSVRLVLFGSLAVALGGVALLLGALQLILLVPAVGSLLPSDDLSRDTGRLLMGALTWGLVGAAFVTLGVGSMRRRRWARTLMLTLSWTWLLCGAASLAIVPALLDLMLTSPGFDTTSASASLVRWFVLAVIGVFGVLVPAAFVWAYNGRDVQRTCEAVDHGPSWTDSAPAPVFGLGIALGACGLLFLPMAFEPAVPWFGRLVTGAPGAWLMVGAAATCLGLSLAVLRRTSAGYWGTTIFMVLVGVSTLVTQLRAPASDWHRALGYPPAEGTAAAGPFGGKAAIAATVAMTVGSVVYMTIMRKHFNRDTPRHASAAPELHR